MKNSSLIAAALVASVSGASVFATDSLTAMQAEEVRVIVREVLADTDARTSLLAENSTAGINSNGGVFLTSGDGAFNMTIGGQIQFRYLLNQDAGSDSEDGFQARRMKLKFKGQLNDWDYAAVLAGSRKDGNVEFEEIYFGRDIANDWYVKAGTFKLPFAFQELISSSNQVSVDRALTTEFFTMNRGQGVQLQYKADGFRWLTMLSDGNNNSYSEIESEGIALTSRLDYVVIGSDKMKNNFAASEGAQVLRVGAAAHYEDFSDTDPYSDGDASLIAYTADVTYKLSGLGAFAAFYGIETEEHYDEESPWGFLAQVDYGIADTDIDFFGRWETIDNGSNSRLEALTAGFNYHYSKNVKITADVVWVYEGVEPDSPLSGGSTPVDSGGLGMPGDFGDDDSPWALRTQVQLKF